MSDMKFTTAGDYMNDVNGFRKLQRRLTEEGWFVGWNLPCCQSCAWGDVPYGADLDKVLFNHSQDCEVYLDGEECSECEGTGMVENPDYDTEQLAEEHDDDLDEFIDCTECGGRGEIEEGFDPSEYDTSVSGFVCMSPEQQSSSMFCFSGDEKGVENLKSILPIIEECGCTYHWSGNGDHRIEISWDV